MSDERNTKSCEELIDGKLADLIKNVRAWESASTEQEDTLCKCGHPYGDHDDEDDFCLEDECECMEFERADDTDKWDENDNPIDAIGVSKKIVTTITMSWGGPADYLEVHQDFDDDKPGDILEIYYIYQDWFDSASRRLTGEEFDLVERAIRAWYYLGDY